MMKEVSSFHPYTSDMVAKKKKGKRTVLNQENIFPAFPNSHTLLRLNGEYHEELGQQYS